jgi:hypothetical protein
MPGAPGERVIRASEVGQHGFCARAWWLGSVQRLPSNHRPEMAQGEPAHRQHARQVWWSVALARAGRLLLAQAVLAGLVALWPGR